MQKWLVKAYVQKAISYLPQAHWFNYQLQKITTFKNGIPDSLFLDRLSHFTEHYHAYKKYIVKDISQLDILELGTGWHPIVPLAFYLSGADNLTTLDIRSLISGHSLKQTLARFRDLNSSGNLTTYIPDLNQERLSRVLSTNINNIKPEQFLRQLGIITKQVPAGTLNLTGYTPDIIISNNVLQDIRGHDLERIFREIARIAKPGMIMSHGLDMADQFSHFDQSITPFNYLQFSEAEWDNFTNGLQRQNRLRLNFYRQLFRKINLTVLEEVNITGKRQDLQKVILHPDFQNIPEKEILVIQSHVIGKF